MPTAVVTGGGGYVGLRLCRKLLSMGWAVRLFDIRMPPGPGASSPSSDVERYEPEIPPGAAFIVGDVCSKRDVEAALQGADVVFHIASYGMSGAEALRTELIYRVNVKGTETIIAACIACGVPRLVYTSTVNTVFCGRPIDGGDESWPCVDPDSFWDVYSRTKALAEQLVLAANGTPLLSDGRSQAMQTDGQGTGEGKARAAGGMNGGCWENGEGHVDGLGGRNGAEKRGRGGGGGGEGQGEEGELLRTCALRPSGIYGPGECRHFPRLVTMVRTGLFRFIFDHHGSKTDWLHVENLIQALALAAEGLGPEKGHVAAGQAYFVTDDQPVNNFEFFRPFIVGLGYPFPSIRVPYTLVFYVGGLLELIHAVLKPLGVPFTPVLNRSEVNKCSVMHWFRIDKAKRELGYKPQRFDMEETVAWFRERGFSRGGSWRGEQRGAGAKGGGAAWAYVLILALVLGLLCWLLDAFR